MTWDLKLFYFFNNFAGQNFTVDFLVIFFAEYLQYVLLVGFLFLLFFSPKIIRQEKLRIFFVTAISVVVARLGVTELIRLLYHRPRPYVTYQVHQLIAEQGWSFPSGHSAFFFAMAAALYHYNKKWGIGFFIAAIVMNISRVIAGVHYPSDIIGGIFVGISAAYLIFYCMRKIGIFETRVVEK